MHHIKEGMRMVRRRWWSKPSRYKGSPQKICRTIIKNCYNASEGFFQVSTGHFNQFYIRDFGLCVEALMRLGHTDKVKKSLEYALSIYSRHGKITTQITPGHVPIDTFGPAADSLPFLLHALHMSGQHELCDVYRPFLEQATDAYVKTFLDKNGMIRSGYVGSMKDNAVRHSSCYDNTMAAWLSDLLEKNTLRNPLKKWDLKKSLQDNFWMGTHFRDDLNGDVVAGDANVFPFWCNIVGSDMAKPALDAIRAEGLDVPFPLKYTLKKQRMLFWPSVFAPNYEGSAIWTHLGLAYLDVVATHAPQHLPNYLYAYEKLITMHRNFLEVYHPTGEPYSSAFYRCDEGMVWAAKWLHLKNES